MEILKFPHPILLTETQPVTHFSEDVAEFLEKMWTTMKENRGIGLAANQVGLGSRMFVMEGPNEEKLFFVNPEIMGRGTAPANLTEGCLSAPGEFIKLSDRSQWIVVKYKNEKGEAQQRLFTGIFSVCVQHELDHLNGKAFLDSPSIPKNKRNILKNKWGLWAEGEK